MVKQTIYSLLLICLLALPAGAENLQAEMLYDVKVQDNGSAFMALDIKLPLNLYTSMAANWKVNPYLLVRSLRSDFAKDVLTDLKSNFDDVNNRIHFEFTLTWFSYYTSDRWRSSLFQADELKKASTSAKEAILFKQYQDYSFGMPVDVSVKVNIHLPEGASDAEFDEKNGMLSYKLDEPVAFTITNPLLYGAGALAVIFLVMGILFLLMAAATKEQAPSRPRAIEAAEPAKQVAAPRPKPAIAQQAEDATSEATIALDTKKYFLRGLSGGFSGKLELKLSKSYIVGRSRSQSDIVVDDKTVSRKHFQLAFSGSHFTLTNLSQTNPTKVNGKGVKEQVLAADDVIKVGDTEIQYICIG